MLSIGQQHTDFRGTLNFVNDFNFTGVRRFYSITHVNIEIVRAWQGHKIETKHFFVSQGSFLIASVQPDNWEKPSRNLTVNQHILRADQPAVLTIPAGSANGFRALEPNSTVIVFSSLGLEDSIADTYRFAENTWDL